MGNKTSKCKEICFEGEKIDPCNCIEECNKVVNTAKKSLEYADTEIIGPSIKRVGMKAKEIAGILEDETPNVVPLDYADVAGRVENADLAGRVEAFKEGINSESEKSLSECECPLGNICVGKAKNDDDKDKYVKSLSACPPLKVPCDCCCNFVDELKNELARISNPYRYNPDVRTIAEDYGFGVSSQENNLDHLWDKLHTDVDEPFYNLTEGFGNNTQHKLNHAYIGLRHTTFLNKARNGDYYGSTQPVDDYGNKILFSEEKLDTLCKEHAKEVLDVFLSSEKRDLTDLLTYCRSLKDNYKSAYLYKSSLFDIIKDKNKELKKIQDQIDNYKTNLFVDNRKNYYKQENYEFYKTIWFYLLIIYYSFFIIYLIFSKFIQNKLYLDKKNIFLIVFYLILPIILKFVLNFIVEMFIYYLESNNIKKEVQSYADIIKNNDKTNIN